MCDSSHCADQSPNHQHDHCDRAVTIALELYEVDFTYHKVREKAGKVCLSLCCVFTPFPLDRVGS